jgi:hypothetical protein
MKRAFGVAFVLVVLAALYVQGHGVPWHHAGGGPPRTTDLGRVLPCPESRSGCLVGVGEGGGTVLIPMPTVPPPPCVVGPPGPENC